MAGDSIFTCTFYTANYSYNDCVQDEMLDAIEGEIGCQPPLLAKDLKNMCNKRFNVSAAQSLRLETLLKPLYYKDKSFDCFERALDKNNQPEACTVKVNDAKCCVFHICAYSF